MKDGNFDRFVNKCADQTLRCSWLRKRQKWRRRKEWYLICFGEEEEETSRYEFKR